MADYKIPNLCGASVPFNAMQSKFDDMINTAASPAGLIADAKALAASLEPDVTALLDEVKNILPELPALPDVNLQAELTSLSGLSAGSFEHGTLLAEITTKFGSGLTAGGYSIDTLVDTALDAVAGLGDVDMCGGVPNFTIPAAGGTAIEKAVGVKQADVNSVVEELSTLVKNDNFVAEKAAVEETFTSYEEIGEEVPAEDIGPYRVSEETTKVVVSDNQGSVTTIEATTPSNSVGESTTVTTATTSKTITTTESGGKVTERKRSNVAEKGFTRRQIRVKEKILLDDVGTGGDLDYQFTLKNTPWHVINVYGYDPTHNNNKGAWLYIAKAETRRARKQVADFYTLDGKTIMLTSDVREYDEDSNGHIFRVKYKYLDTYDPNFAGPI